MTAGFCSTPIALLAGLLLTSGAASPSPAGPDLVAAVDATCPINIKASNGGSTDVYVMLYESQTIRRSAFGQMWVKLKIQNHRVAPGATMTRSYTAVGSCTASRGWRFQLKKGTDFFTLTQETYKAKLVDLGDVSKNF